MSTQTHLDQLDILSTYMRYWIEFKDKERIREENLPKDTVKMGVGFMTGDGTANLNKVVQGSYAQYVFEKQEPMPFVYVTETFSKIIPKIGQEKAKQSVIKSIQNSFKI